MTTRMVGVPVGALAIRSSMAVHLAVQSLVLRRK